ncbi:MAG: GNAT family N-acetyltransferase [Ruminococcaceae bacterium]|nr:GNAT family N-acetyltransferase [Oscillospiraceae bacterium]
MYSIENYIDNERFNNQFGEIHNLLQIIADNGYNEHFHWGRFDWMMSHSYLDIEMLTKNAVFRDESSELVGAVLYDTGYKDRWYILHSISDEALLRQMIDYATENDISTTTIKANLNDTLLCNLLEKMGFEKQYSESVLEIDLSQNLSYQLPEGFYLNDKDSEIDDWQWSLVIYHGFDHEGIPEEASDEVKEAQKHLKISEYIKVFAIKDGEYTAHCGVWYNYGDTAYIEPVVTVPEHRGKGLGKAVVYEAINRAKQRGAKRAIVLSDQEFYKRLGMTKSSEVGTWIKNHK